MSRGIKTIAKIALPIAGTVVGSMVGMPMLGATLGGALGGAVGGGGLKGIALGALGGYASGSLGASVIGNTAGTTLDAATGVLGAQGPTYGSGIAGAVTGGGTRALTSAVTSGAAGAASDPTKFLMNIGNQLMTESNAQAAEKAAKTQSQSIDRALAANQPYRQLGTDAVAQIRKIQADPAGYIKTNPLYTTLAADAERRLTANQAAKGKLGSGGTTSALQEQLLGLGTGLVNNQIANLQGQANTGYSAATNAGNLYTGQGDVNAAGQMGKNNAYNAGYQDQINMLLAMQGMNKQQTYSPNISL